MGVELTFIANLYAGFGLHAVFFLLLSVIMIIMRSVN